MDDELETTPKHAKSDNVAGISRSGRVRKKSMKLRDFESLDEVEATGRSSSTAGGAKKLTSSGGASVSKASAAARSTTVGNVAAAGLTSPVRFAPKQSFTIKEESFSEEELIDAAMYTVKTECDPLQSETFTDVESEHEMNFTHNEESSLDSSGSEFNELDESILHDKDMEEDGFQAIGSADTEYAGPAAAQSLYLLEKAPAKKKLVIKDGKIMGKAKSPRKDKGQSRVTAYMLWAKEIRQELIGKNPELDFSQISKRLGELWATVPYEEQYIWKKRAKRLATKAISPPNKTSLTTGLLTGGGVANANVVTTTSSGVTAATSVHRQQRDVSPPKKKMMKSPPGTNRKSPGISTGAVVAMNQVVATSATLNSPDKVSPKPIVDSTVFKPVGTAPLDIAAHLRLLGESLTIIGERLTEHDGQITVSGISSVLLDSLLCALAPLMCLTQRVPEMNVIPQERLSQMMDNIAYIMPGL